MADKLKTVDECYSAFTGVVGGILKDVESIVKRNESRAVEEEMELKKQQQTSKITIKKKIEGPSIESIRLANLFISGLNAEYKEKILRSFVFRSSPNWQQIFKFEDSFFLSDESMFQNVSEQNMDEIMGLKKLWSIEGALTPIEKIGFFKVCISLTNICKRWARLEKPRLEMLLKEIEKKDTNASEDEKYKRLYNYLNELNTTLPLWEDYVDHKKCEPPKQMMYATSNSK
jgi:intein/homing endonuclease